MSADSPISTPLTPEDLTMWYADQPRQRTTMALLMLLDRPPDGDRLRAAVARAVEAIPRMRQVVVDAPFDISLPRWEDDPTFDPDFHVRRYAQAPPDDASASEQDELEALFHTIGPIYERPFDRTRPLWELIEIDRSGGRSAIFFRLHHAMADGVGGNAILAALSDADRDGEPLPPPAEKTLGAWPESRLTEQLRLAVVRRAGEAAGRLRTLGDWAWQGVRDPSAILRVRDLLAQLAEDTKIESQSPLTAFGRSRHLSGIDLDFEPLRQTRRALGGRTIDLLLSGVAGAMGRWHRAHGHDHVEELATLVPIQLRPPEEFGLAAAIGNRASGIMVRLPIGIDDPVERFRAIHERVEARRANHSSELLPALGPFLAAAPRWLFRRMATQVSNAIDLIVTNVPGINVPRYIAGAEITAGYPIAPTAPHVPVSIALYGYRGRLFVGLDADGTAMPDLAEFKGMLVESFGEVSGQTGT